MRRLIDLTASAPSPSLIFQCWFGVSRSTAALLIAATALGLGSPRSLAGRLRQLAPWATPNPLLIRLGDEALGCNGALSDAVAAIGRGEDIGTVRPFRFDGGDGP